MKAFEQIRWRVLLAVAVVVGMVTACYPPAGAAPPLPQSYRGAVAHAAASVVSVYASGEISRGGIGPNVQTLSIGSGVILDPTSFVVTNGRLFQGVTQLVVSLGDGTPFPAALVGLDPDSGLALLKIEATDLKPIEMGNIADIAVGDVVLAIGNPPGIGQTVSQGIIGAIARNRNGIDGYIETDAAIAPGGYGGALVDTAGRLVGIMAVTIAIGDEQPGIRLALPVDRVQEVVARLKKTGRNA